MRRDRSTRRWPARAALGLVVIALAGAAAALPPDLEQTLSRLPAEARARLQAQGARWDSWNESERRQFGQRAAQWEQRPAGERGAVRERYRAWQNLSAGDRAEVQAAAARYAALPPEQQQALRARFDALDGSERHGWLLGPQLGADYPALQPLLAQLPAPQHAALLAALHGLSAQQRKDLAVLVQRTPPQERARLRGELLAAPAASRGAWLQDALQR
ncbi:DUF3106 domain-containing protein [Lysobacter sp. BMK333-48F3]|uniref:DUF3106 domain-containing protein n=1 Tax=Lysobacter sp. BMK333-48F3 TaxID=2867962 RepID=UPI001C8B2646|nr:DUF3106 domain-containing protein [Lysobacter sp. BMK333-48F3]MBX9400659.1 DUF3106 domain-containing protein [Lysobacter sp. BMK333-48F3]